MNVLLLLLLFRPIRIEFLSRAAQKSFSRQGAELKSHLQQRHFGVSVGDNESLQRETLLTYCGVSPVSLSLCPRSLGYGHKVPFGPLFTTRGEDTAHPFTEASPIGGCSPELPGGRSLLGFSRVTLWAQKPANQLISPASC